MKQTIRLTENKLRDMIYEAVDGAMMYRRPARKAQPKRMTEGRLRNMINEAVKKALSEVKYNGVSRHGNNPYDWKDLADERENMENVYDDQYRTYKKAGDTQNAEKADDMSMKQYRNKKRNLKNAKVLGWQGEGDTRLAGATRAANQGNYERANMLLGDVEGRANQNIAKINAAKGAY